MALLGLQPQLLHLSTKKRITKPLSTLVASGDTKLSYELKQGQYRHFHRLPSGLAMEVIVQKAHKINNLDNNSDSSGNCSSTGNEPPLPPLVFVHGSFHAAWCWAEHWLPFFSAAGCDCYALSLLGQGESDLPEGSVAGTLETHTRDIADFIRKEVSWPPVLIGHSFGGLIIQSYMSKLIRRDFAYLTSESESGNDGIYPTLKGAVLMCSVPPSGNSGLVWRYLLTKPIAAVKVTLSLAAKAFSRSLPLCKETFFSSTMEGDILKRYQVLMRESSRVPLFDLRKLNASLPVPSIPKGSMEILVIGATNDFIVDAEGLEETARFYGVQPVCVDGVAHDMMLDSSWERGAEIILSWLQYLNS